MRLAKIFKTMYRVYNGNKTKDVYVIDGKIMKPKNPYNKLTEEELDFLMDKLINE